MYICMYGEWQNVSNTDYVEFYYLTLNWQPPVHRCPTLVLGDNQVVLGQDGLG
jgi:hypothetical protein